MAERERPAGAPPGVRYSEAVEAVRGYYNSDDARRVYETAYGDEHLHLGIYENDDDTIDEAGRRTMERMASMVRQLGPASRVLDRSLTPPGSLCPRFPEVAWVERLVWLTFYVSSNPDPDADASQQRRKSHPHPLHTEFRMETF